jgi:FixJ family two-component response regulator
MESLASVSRVHVIDLDFRRRAQISRQLMSRDFHTEIYEDSAEFLGSLPNSGPVLLNEEPSQGSLAEFFGAMRQRGRFYPVSVYSDAPSPEQIVRAMRHGAMDYLQWPFDADTLDQSLRRLFEEGKRRLKVERERSEAREKVGKLTQRETDVLISLLRGNSNKEVAEELSISHRTVEIYRKNMMDKLNARSASEAARIGIYADLWAALPD